MFPFREMSAQRTKGKAYFKEDLPTRQGNVRTADKGHFLQGCPTETSLRAQRSNLLLELGDLPAAGRLPRPDPMTIGQASQ